MTGRWMLMGAGVVIVAGVLSFRSDAGPSLATGHYRVPTAGEGISQDIARKLVMENARVREGEFVLINGGARDLELLEDLAIETRRTGAWPMVTLNSDRMTRLMYDDVPAEFDTQRPELAVRLVGLFPVNINIDFVENSASLKGVPPERIAARATALQPVGDLAREFNVRTINLGNGFYPTKQQAELFGISQKQLEAIFWAGVNVDHETLRQTGLVIKRFFDEGRTLRITKPNGTDLTVQLAGTGALISDGVVSAEDERLGGAATTVWLPAGEVFVAPMPNTAEGVIVADHFFFQGEAVEELRLEFAKGRLESMTAAKGVEAVQAYYDVSGEGRDLFSVVDIGINPNMEIVPGSRMVGWVPAGMVTIGVGNNAWAGGANNVGFSIYPFLPGTTVEVDGVVIVRGGVLQTETLMGMK